MTPSPPINHRSDDRHPGRLPAGSAQTRIAVLDSPPLARPIWSRDAQIARSLRHTHVLGRNPITATAPLQPSKARARG
jgi:hypothetical protein